MELVSVIMPYYKKKAFVERSINSVLRQTYKNYELIIIYDDSNLEDLFFLRKITREKKCKILLNKQNLGAGLSRNKGISAARGKYLAFIDADDTWSIRKLEKQIAFMRRKNLDVTHTSYKILNNRGEFLGFRKAKDLVYKNLLKSCDIGLSTVILKKKILLDNSLKFTNLRTKEDYLLWLKISKLETKFYGLKNVLTIRKEVKNSLSSSTFQKIKDSYLVYNKYMNFSFSKSLFLVFQLSLFYLWKYIR